MYDAILFLHVASAFAFFLFHGGVASVSFALERDRDPERLAALQDLVELTGIGGWISTLVIVVSGIALTMMGDWWREGWAWLSLLILLVTGVVMFFIGIVHLGLRLGTEEIPAKGERWYTTVQIGLWIGSRTPVFLAVIGMIALALILWLMMFKPF